MCFFRKRKKAKEEEAKRLAEEKAAKEKAEREAKERAEKQRLAKEAKERAEKEKAEKEKAEKEMAEKEAKTAKTKKTTDAVATKKAAEENDEVDVEVQEKTRKALYRVVFDKEDKLWKIKKDGAKRVIDSKKTKEEALARVQELADSQDSKFVVYKKDGKFQKKANLNLKSTDKGDKNN